MIAGTRPRSRARWLIVPAWGWFAAFLLAPLAIVLAYSLAMRGTYGGVIFRFSLESFVRAFDPLYLSILWNSVWLALLTCLSCLLIGYPMAYAMATARPPARRWLLALLLLPFWTNVVVRAYSIKLLLPSGPFAVWVGMVTTYLPFMVLPIYVALGKFDFSLVEAARDLGAPPRRILREILLPGTRAGILAGMIFVFAPALGEFVIPDLLGGAQVMLVGNLVSDQFLKARDWPFGAALSTLLVGAALLSLGALHAVRKP